jgi:hypothetical protein
MILARFPAGQFDFECYLKPSGSLGVVGLPDAALEGTFGIKTVNGGASVVYSLATFATVIKTYSIFYRKGEFVFQNAGCVFNKLNLPIKADGSQASLRSGKFGGMFSKQYIAGKTLTAAGSTTTLVNVAAGTGKYFDAGAFISITGFTAGGNAWIPITSIAGDVLTVPTLSGSPGTSVVVQGYLPTPTDSGSIINNYLGSPTYAAVAFPLVGGDIDFEVPLQYLDDEMNGQAYPTDFVYGIDKRKVIINAELYFKNANHKHWYDAKNLTAGAMAIPFGSVAGKIIQFDAANAVQMAGPQIADNPLKVKLQFRCKATSALDDECTLTYK